MITPFPRVLPYMRGITHVCVIQLPIIFIKDIKTKVSDKFENVLHITYIK